MTNKTNKTDDNLMFKHGGYRELKSYQMSTIVYDATVEFCKSYVDKFSRTNDQMVQAARSGRQNIAEGSRAAGTSKKSELKLTMWRERVLKSCFLITKILFGKMDYELGQRMTLRQKK